MKLRTIGCVELSSIGMGMQTADEMIKAANVELVMARTTCPGRYLIVVTGDTGAVTSSVQTGLHLAGEMVVDSFVIPNVHESVIPAMNGTAIHDRINALGVIETYTAASCVLAADAATDGCTTRGEIGVSVKDKVGLYRRNDLKVRDELETMARNEAVGLSADAIKPLDEPYAGEQRFAAYRCGSVVPTRRTTPPSAPASQPLKLEEAETYPVRED